MGRQRSRSGSGQEQVSAVLEIECLQIPILPAVLHLPQQQIRGQIGRHIFAEIERHPAKERAIIRDVPIPQCLVGPGRRRVQSRLHLRIRIGIAGQLILCRRGEHVGRQAIIGAERCDNVRTIRADNANAVCLRDSLSAGHKEPERRRKPHPVLAVDTAEGDRILLRGTIGVLPVPSAKRHLRTEEKRQRTLFGSRQADDQHTVGIGGEHLSCIPHAAAGIFRLADRRGQIETAAIFAHVRMTKVKIQLRKIRHTAVVQLCLCLEAARNKGIFRDLDPFRRCSSKYICAKPAAADRKGPFFPAVVRIERSRMHTQLVPDRRSRCCIPKFVSHSFSLFFYNTVKRTDCISFAQSATFSTPFTPPLIVTYAGSSTGYAPGSTPRLGSVKI